MDSVDSLAYGTNDHVGRIPRQWSPLDTPGGDTKRGYPLVSRCSETSMTVRSDESEGESSARRESIEFYSD